MAKKCLGKNVLYDLLTLYLKDFRGVKLIFSPLSITQNVLVFERTATYVLSMKQGQKKSPLCRGLQNFGWEGRTRTDDQ